MTTRVAFSGGSWSPGARFDHEVTYWGCPGQAKADPGPIQPNPGQPGLGQQSKPEPGPGSVRAEAIKAGVARARMVRVRRSEPVVGEVLEAGEFEVGFDHVAAEPDLTA